MERLRGRIRFFSGTARQPYRTEVVQPTEDLMLQQHGTDAQASLFRPAGVTDNVPKVTDGPLLSNRVTGKEVPSLQGFQAGASRFRDDRGRLEGGLAIAATERHCPAWRADWQ